MDRRQFSMGLLATLSPVAAHADYDALVYERGLLGRLRAENRPIILNYTASWSYTCDIKRERLAQLKRENAAYSARLTFVDIDWDTFGPSQMAQRMDVDRHCTLIAMKGETEICRLVAETNEGRLRAFLDKVLQAA